VITKSLFTNFFAKGERVHHQPFFSTPTLKASTMASDQEPDDNSTAQGNIDLMEVDTPEQSNSDPQHNGTGDAHATQQNERPSPAPPALSWADEVEEEFGPVPNYTTHPSSQRKSRSRDSNRQLESLLRDPEAETAIDSLGSLLRDPEAETAIDSLESLLREAEAERANPSR